MRVAAQRDLQGCTGRGSGTGSLTLHFFWYGGSELLPQLLSQKHNAVECIKCFTYTFSSGTHCRPGGKRCPCLSRTTDPQCKHAAMATHRGARCGMAARPHPSTAGRAQQSAEGRGTPFHHRGPAPEVSCLRSALQAATCGRVTDHELRAAPAAGCGGQAPETGQSGTAGADPPAGCREGSAAPDGHAYVGHLPHTGRPLLRSLFIPNSVTSLPQEKAVMFCPTAATYRV